MLNNNTHKLFGIIVRGGIRHVWLGISITAGLLDSFAFLLLDFLGNLVAELLWYLFALLDWGVVTLLPHRRHAAGHELLDVGVFTDTARHRSALLGVDVLLDLLRLLTLLKLANFLLLIVANLFLGGERNFLGQLFTNFLLPDFTFLGRDSSWGGVALGVMGTLTFGLLTVR